MANTAAVYRRIFDEDRGLGPSDIGERGREYVLRHHTYPVLAQRFLHAMEQPA